MRAATYRALGAVGYDYLMFKETMRAFIVGGLSAAAVGLMPRCGRAVDGVEWRADGVECNGM